MTQQLICEVCEHPIKGRYLEINDERYCSNCYESESVVSYFVEGEHIADDVDGAVECHTEGDNA